MRRASMTIFRPNSSQLNFLIRLGNREKQALEHFCNIMAHKTHSTKSLASAVIETQGDIR